MESEGSGSEPKLLAGTAVCHTYLTRFQKLKGNNGVLHNQILIRF